MRIEIDPTYEHLREWIERLPNDFAHQGRVIYDARNQIRVIKAPDGKDYNIKRYCQPKWYNRIIYSTLRLPKAQRAYENARKLEALDIPTPHAIGYILCGKYWLEESYLVCEQSNLRHTLYEAGTAPETMSEKWLVDLAELTAKMHQRGVLHLDFSPGNILFDQKEDNKYQFSLVDINRMQFGKEVSIEEGCKSMARLWGKEDLYDPWAIEYARLRGGDEECCKQWVRQARRKFWCKRKHESVQYTERDEK